MSVPEKLAASAGRWLGSNRLHDPNTNQPEDSPSTAFLTPILGGKFLRFDYTWGYQGKPQEGSMLIGGDPRSNAITAHWIDSWHNGDSAMACQGAVDEKAALLLRGSYSVPGHPDWGWRIDIHPHDGRLTVMMFNISPEGQEVLAVEASYRKG